jgi:mono/diheme cytochrome c family protein
MSLSRRFAIVILTGAMLLCAACSRHAPRDTTVNAMDDSVATPAGASSARGKALFAAQCAACHGAGGSGGQIGPSLRNERARKDRDAVIRAIEQPSSPMPKLFPGTLTSQDVADLTAYVESL